jgi:uncharacterized protein (DUF302 family)
MSDSLSYGFKRTVDGDVAAVEERVRSALAAEGFGILTEIDVAATFKAKLGIDFRPYKILGACSPPIAHAALDAEEDMGLLLPCNVIVYARAKGRSVVAVLDPVQQLGISGRDDLGALAADVRARLKRAIDAV